MTKEKICGIYCIENLVNHKKYIGQSIDIKSRWRIHKHDFRKNIHCNDYFQKAWNKYGERNFLFTIITECAFEELDQLEKFYINKFKTTNRSYGYNLESGGTNKSIVSDETREKLRIASSQNENNGRKVICLNTMEIFNKQKDACKKYKIQRSGLDYCCNGILRFCGRMEDGTPIQWSYYYDNKKYTYKPLRMILQYSLHGQFISSYNTLELASKSTGISSVSIGNCCRMKTISSGGYIWVYSDNKDDSIDIRLDKYRKSKEISEETRKKLSEAGKKGQIVKRNQTSQ